MWRTPQLQAHGRVETVTGIDFISANCQEGMKGPGRADSCTLAGMIGLTGSPLG